MKKKAKRTHKTATPEGIAQAKTFYIFGYESEGGKRVFPTLKKAAKIAGVPYFTVSRLASDEEWSKEREIAQQELYQRLKEEMIARHIEASGGFKDSIFEGAKLLVLLTRARLQEIATAQQAAVKKGGVVDYKDTAIKSWDVRDLSVTLQAAMRVGAEALGEETLGKDYTWKDLAQQARGSSYRDEEYTRLTPNDGEGHEETERETDSSKPEASD